MSIFYCIELFSLRGKVELVIMFKSDVRYYGINSILDPIFIFIFKSGVRGASSKSLF